MHLRRRDGMGFDYDELEKQQSTQHARPLAGTTSGSSGAAKPARRDHFRAGENLSFASSRIVVLQAQRYPRWGWFEEDKTCSSHTATTLDTTTAGTGSQIAAEIAVSSGSCARR